MSKIIRINIIEINQMIKMIESIKLINKSETCHSSLKVSGQLTKFCDELCTFSTFHFLFGLESKILISLSIYIDKKWMTNLMIKHYDD